MYGWVFDYVNKKTTQSNSEVMENLTALKELPSVHGSEDSYSSILGYDTFQSGMCVPNIWRNTPYSG
jgi:hypothetical protein